MLDRGRHSDALRRYELVRRRYRRAFGEDPGFSLADVAAAAAPRRPPPAGRHRGRCAAATAGH